MYTSLIKFVPIRLFHISHNAPYLPPKFGTTFVFHLPWVLQPSQEKLNKGSAKFRKANKVHYGKFGSGV